MLKTKENIKNHLDNLNPHVALDLISSNFLKYILTDIYPLNDTDIKAHSFYKMNFSLKQDALVKICSKFNKYDIRYIAFKGVVLSHKLYTHYKDRYIGDLDIYVDKKDFELALNILFEDGFHFFDDNIPGEHHIVLCKNQIIIELHKNILNPFTKINEEYLLNHTSQFIIKNINITTFDQTATLLHLLYHLYMDAWLSFNNKYVVYSTKKTPSVNRFLYRAYEIALFTEKHFDKIKWDEIINDIKKQKLRIIFSTMINDILKIFPNAFPKHFIDAVNNMVFVGSESDVLYKYIVDSNLSNENIDVILSNFIDSQWNKRVSENIQIDAVGGFALDNPIVKDQERNNNYQLCCTVQIEKIDEGIKLEFRVSNDDFCFSETKDYNTQTSDGVHLIICGTKKYSFNSIFLFPKVVGDKIIVVPVNVLNGENSEINELLISTSYQKFETEYLITAVLKNEFLQINNIEEYFYLGLVISDCSNKTKKRKSELILSDPYSEWYNPAYFAKIKIC